MTKVQRIASLFIVLFLFVIQFIFVIKGIQNDCFHATDFSIYQQAILDVDFLNNLNPYLSIRNINIFNDHFDPIIYLATLFVNIFGQSPEVLIIFEFLWPLLTLGLIYILPTSKDYNLKLMLFFIFTKGVLTGLQFPIHPSTWSVLPLFILFKQIEMRKSLAIILSVIFLFTFREVFPFATIFLSFALLLDKRKSSGLIIFLVSVVWIIFVYKLRPYFFGEIHNYGSMTISNILNSPIETIKKIKIIPAIKLLYPFFIPYFLILRSKSRSSFVGSPSYYALAFAVPLIGLHLLTNSMHFQYGAFLVTPLLCGLFLDKHFIGILNNKKLFAIMLIPFVASSIGTHTKAFKGIFANKISKCSLSNDVKKSRKEVREVISRLNLKTNTMIATGGVIPAILKKDNQIYQLGLFSKVLPNYDYVYFSRNESGDTYPYTREQIKQFIENCSFGSLLFSDKYFFLAKGLKDPSCLKLNL